MSSTKGSSTVGFVPRVRVSEEVEERAGGRGGGRDWMRI
jgi:hypothetical protein